NARMVRTALTRETWESTNECWIDFKSLLEKRFKAADMPEVIDVIKRRAGLIRGAFHCSTLRNELYNFARIGTFIERADNT
ncbi:alpha-E domain-containing protein, partial [Rhizobium ruizarguesonis]